MVALLLLFCTVPYFVLFVLFCVACKVGCLTKFTYSTAIVFVALAKGIRLTHSRYACHLKLHQSFLSVHFLLLFFSVFDRNHTDTSNL